MKDAIFLSHLIKLLPGDLKEKVRTEKTPAEAATCFLDNMIKPAVESGNMEPFRILLLTMETSDNIHLKKLAQSIKQDFEKTKPVNGKIHFTSLIMYTYMNCCVLGLTLLATWEFLNYYMCSILFYT